MKTSLLALAGLLSLAACNPPTTSTPAATTQAPAGQKTASQPIANSPGTAYQVYRGLLPGQADSITLHLVAAPQPLYDAAGPSSHGSYYGPDGHPYEVQSQPSSPDSLVLADLSPEHGAGPTGNGPVWRLRRQPGGGLAGLLQGQAVRLRLVAPPAGSLTFAVRYLADSLAAYPEDLESPKARFSLQALVPTGGAAAVCQTLQANILRDLRGDTLSTLAATTLPALFKQQRDTFYQEYREDVADVLAATSPDERPSATLNYANQAATYVLHQQGNLLSLGFFSYLYTGGAHGQNGTLAASYDLRTGRRLRYNDIFRPTAAAQLPKLLGQAVRPLVGLAPGTPLGKGLFVSQMPVTHNVFLTVGGVVFIYQPYEIASYAQGEVRVFLPLSAVRALLREDLPLPEASSVANR
ncbi:DUF4163 domain-containing protein [Hymenobacter sp. H14-R3]|uniref:DUF3298 and DUF4163 domain-containing protein n=1 Tax=Hymenobacter sp. H14-R3 TaxID=3046308 RepID=UPI0024BA1567|nr:DUF3298 and DUF4163 domain-containing protein [Hymenobacter sp. H14-R3]MDJ0366374.1 DUF4163 domain-containing protein [Hymenobacter sp. H14-R3]